MADALGVDLDVKRPVMPFVITAASLPKSVVQNAELARKIAAKREWRKRKAAGEIPEDAAAPPGSGGWELAIEPFGVGLAVFFVLWGFVQLVADGLGHLFGFHPGPVGLWIGLIAGVLAGLAVWGWQVVTREQAVAQLVANQRIVSEPPDKRLAIEAHTAATTVSELWPHLPVQVGPPERHLRWALWHLSGELVERRKYAEMLDDLRQNSVGVPVGVPTASDVEVRIKRAEALQQEHDTAARAWLACMEALAGACQRLYDSQVAIGRARQAKRRADEVFGTAQGAERPLKEDISALSDQISAVLDAYERLTQSSSGSG